MHVIHVILGAGLPFWPFRSSTSVRMLIITMCDMSRFVINVVLLGKKIMCVLESRLVFTTNQY